MEKEKGLEKDKEKLRKKTKEKGEKKNILGRWEKKKNDRIDDSKND